MRRVIHGVYVDAQVPDSTDLRIAALHLVMPDHAVLFGTTAMWVLSVDAFQPDERFVPVPACLVPHGASRATAHGVRTVEGYLPEADVMEHGGLRMTVPARTTVDGLRRLRRPFAISAADAMARAGWVVRAELDERIDRLRGFPGVVQARSLVRLVDPETAWPGESWTKLRSGRCRMPDPAFAAVDRRREGAPCRTRPRLRARQGGMRVRRPRGAHAGRGHCPGRRAASLVARSARLADRRGAQGDGLHPRPLVRARSGGVAGRDPRLPRLW